MRGDIVSNQHPHALLAKAKNGGGVFIYIVIYS